MLAETDRKAVLEQARLAGAVEVNDLKRQTAIVELAAFAIAAIEGVGGSPLAVIVQFAVEAFLGADVFDVLKARARLNLGKTIPANEMSDDAVRGILGGRIQIARDRPIGLVAGPLVDQCLLGVADEFPLALTQGRPGVVLAAQFGVQRVVVPAGRAL